MRREQATITENISVWEGVLVLKGQCTWAERTSYNNREYFTVGGCTGLERPIHMSWENLPQWNIFCYCSLFSLLMCIGRSRPAHPHTTWFRIESTSRDWQHSYIAWKLLLDEAVALAWSVFRNRAATISSSSTSSSKFASKGSRSICLGGSSSTSSRSTSRKSKLDTPYRLFYFSEATCIRNWGQKRK